MKAPAKTLYLLLAALAAGYAVQAQNENNSERLITQLKNGTAPGLQFAPVQVPPVAVNETTGNTKDNLITQLRKGTAAGMQFKPVTAAAPPTAHVQRAATVPHQPLPSEQQVLQQPVVQTTAPVLPSQEVKKN
jgi:hypothetical protein